MTISIISGGTVTSPQGFLGGATYSGLKTEGEGKLDLGILYSTAPCVAAGVFTQNKVVAAPVTLCRERLTDGRAQAVVVNSGYANACTGEQGMLDALEMSALVAQKLRVPPGHVLVASTGVIGVQIPMEKVRAAMDAISLNQEGGPLLARAIITTDRYPKERAVALEMEGIRGAIGGIAKGSGMIHPNMGTLLAFLTTDLAVDGGFLRMALCRAVDESFNMVTIDGDTSTNDTVLLLANGLAGNEPVKEGSTAAQDFQQALDEVCIFLAKTIARDGEGATRLIEVRIDGALNRQEARAAARAVAGSSLVKAAVYGGDPNWGRILAAIGRSGAEVIQSRTDLFLGDICLMREGQPQPFDGGAASGYLMGSEVSISANLHLGWAKATAWGCDLTEEYVTFNSAYTT